MTGVLDGVVVLDLSTGIAGPVAGMLLADHGAQVTKVESPGGDPTRAFSGAQVWHRGKRSAVLDPDDPADCERVAALASHADVVVENFAPGVAAQLGIDHDTLLARNPRLVYCSITAYGDDGAHADRPAVDALVAARTGHQWESRGVPGGTLARLAGVPPAFPDLVVPDDCWVAAPRPGPLHSGVPWVSMASAYLATLAISAALRVREQTGRGQRVSTSLFQGALATTLSAWQRVEHVDAPNYQSWISDPRAPKGVFRCADGRWIHQWVPLPDFVISAAEGDRPQRTEKTTRPRDATTRIGMDVNEMLLLHHYQPLMAAAIAKFPAEPWVELGAEVGVPLQPLRSPEEALHDPAFLADGCVIEVDDPELGPCVRSGVCTTCTRAPPPPPRAPAAVGAHTDTVRAEADALVGCHAGCPHHHACPRVAARRRACGRPRTRGRRTLGHDDARRPRRRGHQGQPAARLLLDEHAHRDGVQPRQAQHRDEPQGSRGDGDPARARRHRRRRAAQHALRRGGAPRGRLREPAGDQARPRSTATRAASSTARGRGCPATTRPAPRWPAPTGSTAASITTASHSGRWCRWATPATASSPPSAWCRRSTTGTAPAKGQFVDTSIMYAQLLNASIAWSLADGSRHG